MVLERFSLSPNDLTFPLFGRSDTLELAALILFAVPFFGSNIPRLVPRSYYENSVTDLDCSSTTSVDAPAADAKLLGIFVDQLLGFGGPLLVPGGNYRFNKPHTVLGNSLNRLAVER